MEPDRPAALPFDLDRSRFAMTVLFGLTAAVVGVLAAFEPFVALVAVAGVVWCMAVAFRPILGLFALVAVAPVISGFKRGVPVPGFRLSEILIVSTATILLLVARRGARWSWLDWLAVLYVTATLVLGLIGLARRAEPFTTELGGMIGPLQFLLLFRAVATFADTERLQERCVAWLLLASVPVSALAVLQHFGVSPFTSTLAELTNRHDLPITRASGPFEHWQTLAGYLAVIVILAVGALLIKRPMRVELILGVLAAACIAVVFTLSIGPILVCVVGAVALGVRTKRSSEVILGLVCGVVILSFLFQPLVSSRLDQQFEASATRDYPSWVPHTLAYRYEIFTERNIPAMRGHWVAGYGPDLPPEYANFPFNESLYFALLLRGGLILLAVYAALMLAFYATGRAATRISNSAIAVLTGRIVMVTTVAFVALNAIESYFLGSGSPHVLWSLAGLCTAALAASGRRGVEPVTQPLAATRRSPRTVVAAR